MQTTSAPKKKNMSSQQASLKSDRLLVPHIPQEIITDILILLPVETLVKCRCVSKSWFYLISDINFIRNHLRKSSGLINFNRQRLILDFGYSFKKSSNFHSYYLNSNSIDSIFFSRKDDNKSIELEYPSNDHTTWSFVVGCCDGLVCIAGGKQVIILWNPSTREFNKLPVLDKSLQQITGTVFGFGYDQVSDDYKVVVTKFWDNLGRTLNWLMVYSLRTNSWKKIGDFPCTVKHTNHGVFLNGALHWEASATQGLSSSQIILSLDLGKETYREIALPNYGYGSEFRRRSLCVLEECLSVCSYRVGVCVDIWVMKEYDVRDSWLKMHTIRKMIVPENYYDSLCPVLSISVTREIFFIFRDGFLRYDPQCGTFENSVDCSPSMIADHVPITYVESLVSPNMYNDLRIL